MRKDEYLNTIAQALKQYDTAYVNEIISDYEEHFKDGLSQGKSEEDICAELGDINDIIDEIKDLLGERHLKQFEIARPRAELEKSAGGYQYDEAPREDTDRIRIQFMAGSADVKVFRSPENIVNIYTEDPDDMVYLDCSQRGNTYMGRICPRSSAKFLGTDILLSLLGATVDEVIIEVPYDAAAVEIETTSGDVYLDSCFAETITVATISGDVKIEETQCRQLTISTKSGDAELKRTQAEQADIRTVSGDAHYKKVTANAMNVNTVSGDFGGRWLESRSVYVRTVSGDAAVRICCFGEPYYIYAKTVSGDVRIREGIRLGADDFENENLEDCIQVTVSSVSGDIYACSDKERKTINF